MRLTILLAVVAVLCLAALFRPKFGIFGYMWFAILRPDYLAWAPGAYSMSMALATCTLLGTVIHHSGRIPVVFSNPITRILIALQIPILFSAVFAVNPALTWNPLFLYWKMLIMAFVTVVVIETRKDLGILLFVMAVSIGFLAGKMGLAGVLSGGNAVFRAGYGGMMSDNNALAMAIAMGLPICYYAHGIVKEKWVQAGCVFVAFLTIPAVLFTYSRGAAVALAVGMFFIAWRSKRRALMLSGGAVCLVGFVALAGPALVERLSTVTQIGVHQSTMGRLRMAKVAINMFLDYPLFGVGFGRLNQQSLAGNYSPDWAKGGSLVIHNTYLQILVDSGIFALMLFVGMLVLAVLLLHASYVRLRRADSDLTAFPLLIQGALLVYGVNALTLSRASFDLLYILLGCAAVWVEVDPSRHREEASRAAVAADGASSFAPLSEAPAPAPISKQMEAPPRSHQDPDQPVSSRQPSVGIATARKAELAGPRPDQT